MATIPLRKLAFFALFLSLALQAAALTVSVAPAEGKDYAPPPDGTGSPLEFLVSGCMGTFFDSGWIVTDSAAYRGSREAWSPKDYAMAEAKDGMVDFIIALYVAWAPSAFHKGILLPASVAYSIVRVADGKTVVEGEVKGSSDSEDAAAHFDEVASRVGAQVAQACAKPLKTLAVGGEL
jgi:hypothetical protein